MNKRRREQNMSKNKHELTNQQINKEEITETISCLICWEPETKENEIYKMKQINIFYSDCSCDCNFHLNCFFDWVKKTPTCPICRNELAFDSEKFYLHTLGPYYKTKLMFKKLLDFIKDVIKMIIKYVSILFLLQVSINVIFGILRKYEKGI